VIELSEGAVLFEAPAVLQYLADLHPAAGLAPAAGTIERARLQLYLNFTASELHKSFSPFFAPEPPRGAARDAMVAKIARRFDFIESTLSDGRPHLMGDTFTVADAYTYVVSSWAEPIGISLDRWPHVGDYVARIATRPAVVKARRSEGLPN
jgi:glutathione S-transferase